MSYGATIIEEKRLRPTIWIKEIVLFKSIAPVEVIRAIPFTLGLNIVQGESNDSSDTFESGHGNGKTTLCRLIRYCLGEKTFGQKHVVEEVRYCFPNSYVGAVIQVADEEWSVLRPLGNSSQNYAKVGIKLSELPANGEPQPYEDFLKRIEEVILDTFPDQAVLSHGHSIPWLQILALCSRDQESRYDRFWNWREARSDSGTSKLTKTDASLCVRTILGLLDPEEPKLRKRLDVLESSVGRLSERIKDKQKAPEIHMTILRKKLSEELGVQDAANAPLEAGEIFSVAQASNERLAQLKTELAEIDNQIIPLDRQINLAALYYRELLEIQDEQVAASEVTKEGTAVLADTLEILRAKKLMISEKSSRGCPTGESLVGNCPMVLEQLGRIDEQIKSEQQKTLPDISKREQVAAHLDEQVERKKTMLEQRQEQLNNLNAQKNELSERRHKLNELLKRIPVATEELYQWDKILRGEIPYEELTGLESAKKEAEEEIAAKKLKLQEVLFNQNERAKQFGKQFNELVQKTINTAFRGTITIEEEEIAFRIIRERSLGGEAYETLAVLLADLAILLESATKEICHPGILIHDSPREADLNINVYQRLLEVANAMMTGESSNVPFQYIVTTTTPPSKKLKDSGVSMTTLSGGTGSLFGRQLETSTFGFGQQTMF